MITIEILAIVIAGIIFGDLYLYRNNLIKQADNIDCLETSTNQISVSANNDTIEYYEVIADDLIIQEVDEAQINYDLACSEVRTILHQYIDDFILVKSTFSQANQQATFELVMYNPEIKLKNQNYVSRLKYIYQRVDTTMQIFGYDFNIIFLILDNNNRELVKYMITDDGFEAIK